MSKEMLHGLIDMLPEPDEIEAIEEGRKDREENGTISHDSTNWD